MINIKSIWDTQKPTGEFIIKTRIEEIPHLHCFAATNHITGQHLYIMSVSNDLAVPELKNYRFKGVEIYILPVEAENKNELYIYLLDHDLNDIFSLFIQNILEDIESIFSESEAIKTTLNVVSKWKKLFDKINSNGLSLEQQKGLIGELLFIDTLLYNDIPFVKIFNSWTGPELDDQDFIFGTMGTEIKFTSSKNPSLKITSERQLDNQNLSNLFLTLYTTVETMNNGFSLNSLVYQIRRKIECDLDALNLFNKKLIIIGYHEADSENYNKLYSLVKCYYFNISSEFPKITKSQLALGIYNTSYSIELSCLDKFQVDFAKILAQIQNG